MSVHEVRVESLARFLGMVKQMVPNIADTLGMKCRILEVAQELAAIARQSSRRSPITVRFRSQVHVATPLDDDVASLELLRGLREFPVNDRI